MISVIIPVLNEAKNIKNILILLLDNPQIEIIVVDGGSEDKTVEIVEEMGVKVVSAERGRAKQMNLGASVAQGDILLFLHADTQLPLGFEKLVIQALSQPQIVAGAFSLKIASKLWGIKLIEKMVNVRSQLFQLPYGDQAIFISQDWFQKVGGFPDLPIMEDFELIVRLKKLGKIAIVSTPVITSARRWEKLGVWKTTLINQQIIMAYFLGISPQKIALWYK
ncbi:TIGR04283 family arsenosugar biosynthesis glycosyltransferase [Merismopedia glauca]|uniref:4,4'-diaponeurosporenoate glycosyltransferase n=1 Tax=Merismopedia glauca CCAP 1448/3 TaxID=1296344 RepID=A0A2T1C0F7_9CYAN|nr:TIGR04283 family arsenosugar biosynthesis glycosyltransferase [Merismopedia glauca]PSB01765.1 glycosyltransferase [Merismopedia glauca CCAP 1448/3]